jgi:hypothetical protein
MALHNFYFANNSNDENEAAIYFMTEMFEQARHWKALLKYLRMRTLLQSFKKPESDMEFIFIKVIKEKAI